MYKVYSEQRPNIVMEWSNNAAYFWWDLQAFEDDWKISIKRRLHDDRLLAEKVAHTEFVDADGVSFGTLSETITALNEIYDEELNSANWDVYNIAISLGYLWTRRQWDTLYKTNLAKLILKILF